MKTILSRFWSRRGSGARLAIGFVVILAVASWGLTPKSVFGVTIAWPYAALWGAAGWGASGLQLRPMAALAVLGLAQDLFALSPLGVFMLVNLAAFAVSAALSDLFDVSNEPIARLLAPAGSIAAGVFAIWLLASGVEDHPVRVAPIIASFFTTFAVYIFIEQLFRLEPDPGAAWRGT